MVRGLTKASATVQHFLLVHCNISLLKEQQLYFCRLVLQRFLSRCVLRRLLGKKYSSLAVYLQ